MKSRLHVLSVEPRCPKVVVVRHTLVKLIDLARTGVVESLIFSGVYVQGLKYIVARRIVQSSHAKFGTSRNLIRLAQWASLAGENK